MTANDDASQQTAAIGAISKEFLLVVPLLGSTLAVLYDVGYFTRVNINFFSFFSLSEHIVFALQALPLALSIAFGVVVGVAISGKYFSSEKRGYGSFVRWIVNLSVLPLVVIGYFLGMYGLAISVIVVVLVLSLTRPKGLLMRTIFFGAFAMFAAFAIGYDLASIYLQPPALVRFIARTPVPTTIVETKSGDKLDIKLIRSGDRGMLFLDNKDNQVTLLRWDEIKRVSSAVQ